MSRKKIVKEYFKASLEFDADKMAENFAEDIEIQNIAPNFTRYIYGINQFKRTTSAEAEKMAKEMLGIFDNSSQDIADLVEKDNTVEVTTAFEGTVNKDLGANAPYKKGDVVKNQSRSVFTFNDQEKIVLIQNYLS